MSSLNDIRAAIQERVDALRPSVDEFERLESALAALGPIDKAVPPARPREAVVITEEAPWGYKKDGTPRKRPGRAPAESEPNGSTDGPVPPAAEQATLRITTGGVPPVKEGAEPAYVTQEG